MHIGIFWDFETARIPLDEIAHFAEELNRHVLDSHQTFRFIAVAPITLTKYYKKENKEENKEENKKFNCPFYTKNYLAHFFLQFFFPFSVFAFGRYTLLWNENQKSCENSGDDREKNKTEFPQVMQDAGIKLLPSDDKRLYAVGTIKDEMRRFYDDHHEAGCWIVLITGGSEFNKEINNYKYNLRFENFSLIYKDEDNSLLSEKDVELMTKLAPARAVKFSHFMEVDPHSRAFVGECACVVPHELLFSNAADGFN